jgi:hypothetical protein
MFPWVPIAFLLKRAARICLETYIHAKFIEEVVGWYQIEN